MFFDNTIKKVVLALCFINTNNIVFGDEPEIFVIQANACPLLYLTTIILLIIISYRS